MPRKPKTNLPLRAVIPRKAKTNAAKAKLKAEQSPKKVKLEKKYKEKPEGEAPSKPTYLKMIKAAIAANPDRKGTTDNAIMAYIGANYPVFGNFQARVRVALRNGAEKGSLTCVNKRRWRVVKEEKKKEKATPKKSPKKKSEKETPKKSSKKGKKEESDESEESPKKKVKKEKVKSTKKEVTTKKKETMTKKKEATKKKETTKTKKKDSTKTRASKKKDVKEKPSTKGRGVTKETKGKKKASRSSSSDDKEGDELVWVWQFLENDKRYHNYDPTASDVVEAVYQDYKKNPGQTDVRSVQSGQWHYMVDFREMTQQNILHEAHTKRRIRRFQIPASEKDDGSKCYSP